MIAQSRWRMQAAPIISRVIVETKGKPEKEVRKALHDAYPFGERAMHPYKIWLDEIKRQTGKLWPVGHKLAWQNSKKRERIEQMKLAEWEQLYGRRQA